MRSKAETLKPGHFLYGRLPFARRYCVWRGGWLRTYIRTRSQDLPAGPDGFRRKGPNLNSGLEVRVMSQAYLCAVQPVLPSLNITNATVSRFESSAGCFQAGTDAGA